MWATEQEAAELSGMSLTKFRREVAGLELRGFPLVNPINGRRPIPAILAFWKLTADDPASLAPDADSEQGLERWDDDEGERLSS